jgi:cytochrome c oxidase subunit II
MLPGAMAPAGLWGCRIERRFVGLNGSERPGFVRRVRRRRVAGLALVAMTVTLSGCSTEMGEQWQRGGLPAPATEESPLIGDLWVGTWLAAIGVGVLVWGLILFAAFAYRKRNDELPVQTRFNLPIEFLYTVAPFAIIGALFYWTVVNQNEILDESAEPDLTVSVIGQQWSWTFNYLDEDVYDIGTTTERPTLYLPVDQTVRFELDSPDVIHSFWIPAFYMKMDVIPGRTNSFQVTPNREGTYAGKCAELCGIYHARMLFDVEVVSDAEYQQQMTELREQGQTGRVEAPLRGSYSQPVEDTGVQSGSPS